MGASWFRLAPGTEKARPEVEFIEKDHDGIFRELISNQRSTLMRLEDSWVARKDCLQSDWRELQLEDVLGSRSTSPASLPRGTLSRGSSAASFSLDRHGSSNARGLLPIDRVRIVPE